MQIISLNNHIVRKALCLSLNEMAVLCDIKQMSQEQKYGYTCIKSKDKIAEWLDLSRSTVFSIIDTLIKKGYIERNEIGLKPTSFIYQLDMCQEDIGLWLKSGGVELVTKKIQDLLTPCTDRPESGLPPSRICTQVYNIDSNNIKEKNSKKEKTESRGKTIEEMKEWLRKGLEPYLEKYGRDMLNNFYAHWIEASVKGDKIRMQEEKFFDIPKRLATWHSLSVKNGKFAAPAVRPAQNTSALANQDNHSNYADYVAWCERNNVTPEPERP